MDVIEKQGANGPILVCPFQIFVPAFSWNNESLEKLIKWGSTYYILTVVNNILNLNRIQFQRLHKASLSSILKNIGFIHELRMSRKNQLNECVLTKWRQILLWGLVQRRRALTFESFLGGSKDPTKSADGCYCWKCCEFYEMRWKRL